MKPIERWCVTCGIALGERAYLVEPRGAANPLGIVEPDWFCSEDCLAEWAIAKWVAHRSLEALLQEADKGRVSLSGLSYTKFCAEILLSVRRRLHGVGGEEPSPLTEGESRVE